MAILFDAPVEPDALTTFTREVPLNRTGQTRRLLSMFSRLDVDDNKVDTATIIKTNRVARFRSWDGSIHKSQRDTGSERTVQLPPLSTSLDQGEYETLQLQFARNGGTNQQALARSVYNDAETLTNEVLNRLELAWGDLITDGKLTMLTANGEPALESDYGVPSDQLITVGTAWTTVATAPALDDLIAAYDLYVSRYGEAGSLLASRRAQRLLTQNVQFINAIKGAQTGVTRVTLAEIGDRLASEGLPPLAPAFDESLDVDGVTTRVLAEDKLVFLPPDLDALGRTAMGVTATALELVESNESELSFEEAPGIVGVVEKVGPPYRKFTFVDACGMPVLIDSARLMTMDVF